MTMTSEFTESTEILFPITRQQYLRSQPAEDMQARELARLEAIFEVERPPVVHPVEKPTSGMSFDKFFALCGHHYLVRETIEVLREAGFSDEKIVRILLPGGIEGRVGLARGADKKLLDALRKSGGEVRSPTGDCIDLLAEAVGLSHSTVQQHLARLERDRWITRDCRPSGTFRVALVVTEES